MDPTHTPFLLISTHLYLEIQTHLLLRILLGHFMRLERRSEPPNPQHLCREWGLVYPLLSPRPDIYRLGGSVYNARRTAYGKRDRCGCMVEKK